MKIKIGQTWKHPHGYILKVANYDDTSGKWLMKVCGQNYYFYAKPQTILTWQLQKKGLTKPLECAIIKIQKRNERGNLK